MMLYTGSTNESVQVQNLGGLHTGVPLHLLVEVLDDDVAEGVRHHCGEPGVVEYLLVVGSEVDALPTVVSDSSNRDWLVSNTYKEMVGQVPVNLEIYIIF
jgi:hypothetical protein